ncbi:MliC family protein [Photobacterium kagoshimensis]|uniref:MliC family protein n=1 Tax=Photobacterium kagoshimensis TaxID=2910242 RepID=UPI003D0AB249
MRRLIILAIGYLIVGCSVDQSAFPVEINYSCPAGQFFTVRYPTVESAVIYYLNDVRTLQYYPSGSGAKYQDISGETLLFTKGDEALLEWDEYRLEGCMAEE